MAAFLRAWHQSRHHGERPPLVTDCPFDDPKLCEKWLDVTERQREAVNLAGQGLTIRKIAEKMGIEESTVKTHLKNARDKLGLGDKEEIRAYMKKQESE